MRKIALFILNIIVVSIAFSQEIKTKNNKGYPIEGILLDSETKQAVEFVSVVIYSLPDTVLVTGTMTDVHGKFTLEQIPEGKYIIESSFIGYQNSTTPIEVVNKSITLTSPIMLTPSAISLSEVQVTATRNEKQSSVEKTKINVSRNISSVSGSITEVLKGQSSISIDGENNLYLRGNKNILLLIDDIPTTITTLNSIPASTVDNIEIITNPDVKYDSEGTGGIINIVTKRESIAGFSGAASLNYGIYNKVNGGVNLHYAKGIWNIGLNYNGKYDNATVESSLTRELYSQNTSVEQQINAKQVNSTHTVGLQFNVRPSKKDIISIGVKFMAPKIHNLQSVKGVQSGKDFTSSSFNRTNDITFSRKVIEGSAAYRRIFKKSKHELSVTGSFSRTKGSRPAEYYLENELLQKSSGGGTPTNYTVQADYLKSVSKTGKIETGLKLFSRWNSFEYYFYDYESASDSWILNKEFSNNLEHQEYIYSAYLMYSDTFLKKLDFKVGARAEYNTTNLVQKGINENIYNDYFFPFPYLLLNYKINKSNNLAFTVNRRITRPTYPQLNPFIYVVDQMTYETGNKTLEPEVLDKIELNYSLTREKLNIRSNIYYSNTKDFITQVSLLSSADKLLLTYVNGNKMQRIGADLDITLKFNKYFWLNPSFSLFHSKSNGTYNEIDLGTNDIAWTGNIKATIKPEKETELQLFFNYNSPMELPQFTLNRIYYADVAIKRTFFKEKLSASLTITDIFNTRDWVINSDNKVYKLSNSSKNDTRILWIGLTYNFNSFKANKPKQSSSNTDRTMIKIGAID